MHSCYLCILKTVSFGHYYALRGSIHHITLDTVLNFDILSGLYTILNELQQLQPEDQRFQQPETQKALTQIPPWLDEFLNEVWEQLTIFPLTEQASHIQEI